MKKINQSKFYKKASKKYSRNSIIIGLNRIGILTYHRIRERTRNGEYFLGFIDTYVKEKVDLKKWSDIKYIGTIEQFNHLVQKYNINHAYVAIDTEDVSLVHKIIHLCSLANVEYEFVPEIHDVIYGNTISQIFKDLERPWSFSSRQFFDSFTALILLILFLPLWLLISIIIKIDSVGPTLFSQERIGKGGRVFRIFKFRTMYTDAEKLSGPVLATKNDPRVTQTGRILRKTRLDEIPQLINVIVGDMSFIGPRPERPYFVEKYCFEIPMYKNRLKLKPGLTGLAQVNTGYDESIDEVRNKLKYDLKYLDKNRSLRLNLSILLKTFKVVVTGRGQ